MVMSENFQQALNNSLCLSVTFSKFGIRKKVQSGAVTSAASEDMLHVSKDILDTKQFKEITSLYSSLKKFLRNRCLPVSLFRTGTYVLPIPLINDVDRQVLAVQVQLAQLLEAFEPTYPKLIAEAKAKLKDPREVANGLFDERDYPPIAKLKRAFTISTQYVTFGVPGELKEINPDIYKREITKAEERVAAAADEIITLLRTEFATLVGRLKESLTPDADGKRKKFYASSITNLLDFMEVFKQRNITSDSELAQVVEDAKRALSGIELNVLRKDEGLKEYVQQQMTTIAEVMKPLTAGRARVDEDEEEVAETAA